jgi:hypothetical protein
VNPEQFSEFRHDATHQLMNLNKECEEKFHISSCPRWHYDFDCGTLTFSRDGEPKIVASIQVVGTTSVSGGTWLWAWANQSLPKRVIEGSVKVREFGEKERLPELTQKSWPDNEYLGWEMAAIAAKVLGAKGAYRCPGANGFIYLVYSSLSFASEIPQVESEPERIRCETHGLGFNTYACEHLVANPAQEWFSSDATEDNKWPDAWCADCDVFFQQEGEWNERNEGKMKIKLLCHRCYELFRSQSTSATTDS